MNKAVVFDMDGVIFDTERMLLRIWQEVAQKHNILDMENTLKACLGVNVIETEKIFLRKYGEDFDYHGFRKEADDIFHQEAKEKGIPVKEGVTELLAYLNKEGYKIALASSTRVELVKQELCEAGLLEYFSAIIGGDMVKNSKPDPEIYLRACKELGVTPEQSYAIEDSFNGVRSASSAGLKIIMVPDILQPDETIRPLLFREFASLLDVLAFLMEK